MRFSAWFCGALAATLPACSHDADLSRADADALDAQPRDTTARPDAGAPSTSASGLDASLPGTEFELSFAPGTASGIRLSTMQVVPSPARGALDWDLMLDGYALFTNGGAVGAGLGGAAGPLDPLNLLFEAAPEAHLQQDVAVGALADWFVFTASGVTTRFHIYGLRTQLPDGSERRWKLQILNYRSDADAGNVSGVYQLRYARVDSDQTGETVVLSNIDATAGGVFPPPDTPGACVNLDTQSVVAATRAEWTQQDGWHLCLRRTDIVANGGLSGPGNVEVVDLDSASSAEADVARTPEAETERFEDVDYAALTAPGLDYSADNRIRPAIGQTWVQGQGTMATPTEGAWLVRDAAGENLYLAMVTALIRPSELGVEGLKLRVRPVF